MSEPFATIDFPQISIFKYMFPGIIYRENETLHDTLFGADKPEQMCIRCARRDYIPTWDSNLFSA